jgi:luciferase family oxidoreductase group 1
LLGSSTYSAQAAAYLGTPFSFAYHFAPAMLMDALDAYRTRFRPSEQLAAPHVMLGVSVLCAPTDDEARWLAGSGALAFLRLRQGRPDVYPTPEEAAEYRFTPAERELVKGWTASHVIGGPHAVRAALEQLVARTGVDELMVTTMAHAHDRRLASYRLLAEVWDPSGGSSDQT